MYRYGGRFVSVCRLRFVFLKVWIIKGKKRKEVELDGIGRVDNVLLRGKKVFG